MRAAVSFIVFNFLCLPGFSQSNIRINNYWENTYYINPASISSTNQFAASGVARKQWIGFPGAPQTAFATFAARLFTNKTQETQIGQLGFKVYHDNIGYTNFINISPSFSYSIRMYNNWRMNLGFAYKIQNFSYDMSRANLETNDDPATYIGETKWSGHNTDFGVELVGNSFLIGVASQNLISLFSNNDRLQTNTNFLYGMLKTDLDGFFNLLFGVCGIKNENLYQGEFKVSGILNSNKLPVFELGAFYRTKKEFGVLFGIDLSKTVRLACSYDYNVGGISHSSYGTPEVLLIWNFGKLENCECEDLFK